MHTDVQAMNYEYSHNNMEGIKSGLLIESVAQHLRVKQEGPGFDSRWLPRIHCTTFLTLYACAGGIITVTVASLSLCVCVCLSVTALVASLQSYITQAWYHTLSMIIKRF